MVSLWALTTEGEGLFQGEKVRGGGGGGGNLQSIIVCQASTIFCPLSDDFRTGDWLVSIRIYHDCEGGIEKSVLRITDWHHKACGVMTISDRQGRIFLSHPHMNNGFFFLLTTSYLNYIGKKIEIKILPEKPEYPEM